MPRLLLAAAVALVATCVSVRAQTPSTDDVVTRMSAYVDAYGRLLAELVAEERYTQWIDTEPGTLVVPPLSVTRREIRSDYILTQLADGETWVAFRDAFEVDGVPVRGREDRLVALLSRGGETAWRQAAAIANESARFNIGTRLITRNINVPTFVLELMRPATRSRFRFSRVKGSAPVRGGVEAGVLWELEFRERERPTIVRQATGGDQPLRGTITLHPGTGVIWETRLTWERGPGGHIDVTYDQVSGIDGLVPVRMVEEYRDRRTFIRGEATYSNFRRFETAARVLPP